MALPTTTPTAGPAVSSLTPSTGPAGTSVTITGTGFADVAGVTFGGVAVTSFVVHDATSITIVAPAHAVGAVGVVVTTTPCGASSGGPQFTYVGASPSPSPSPSVSSPSPTPSPTPSSTPSPTPSPSGTSTPPTLTSLLPVSGDIVGGTTVTITGLGFTGATAVTFSTTPAPSFTVDSDTQITAVSPANFAGATDVTVTTPLGTTATGSGSQYTYAARPVVTLLDAATGPLTSGNSLFVVGAGFTGATEVSFDGTAAVSFTVDSDGQITAVAPGHAAGAVDVTVTGPGGVSDPITYTYLVPAPTITLLNPPTGPTSGGTTVVITGTGFTGASAVTFGGSPASYTVNSNTQITAVSPLHVIMEIVNVVVTAAGGASSGAPYSYVNLEAAQHTAVHADTARYHRTESTCGVAVPDAPPNLTATAAVSSIAVSWSPSVEHGSPVTGYTVVTSPGSLSCTTTTTSCVIGATAGTSYTVTAVANSAAGSSGPSVAGPAVPTAPVISNRPPATDLTLTTDKGLITTAETGQRIIVIGTGFAAFSTATITIYSTPLNLGTVITDGNGNFTKPVTIPLGLVNGIHQVIAQGVAPDGTPRAMKLSVTVARSHLAVTGSPVLSIVLTGLLMILAGAWILYLTGTRRRRPLAA